LSNPYIEFVAAVVEEGREAILEAAARGIKPHHLRDVEAALAYSNILDFIGKYSTGQPTPMTVEGETGVELPPAPAQPSEYWIDKIQEIRLHFQLQEAHGEIGDLIEAEKPNDALEKFESTLKELREEGLSTARVTALFSLLQDVYDHYLDVKGGLRGVPYPWKSLDDDTMGMHPEELILFVARTGVGKTWVMTLMALHALKENHKVLFATTELSQRTIATRFFSLYFGIPYDMIRKGKMTIHDEKKFKDAVDTMLDQEGIDVIGGDFDFRIESLESAIEESKPAVVFLDGAYLLKMDGHNRVEKAANAFNELKRLAKRKKVPIVITWQFNRDAKKSAQKGGSGYALESISLSDVGAWNSDMIVALWQDDELKKDKKMGGKPLKGREGVCRDFQFNWDFEYMDFSDIGGGGDAYEPDDDDDPVF
jgi:replicative DNA helicase